MNSGKPEQEFQRERRNSPYDCDCPAVIINILSMLWN